VSGPEASSETVSVRVDPGGHTLVPRFWMLVVGGPDTGATFTSQGDLSVIGTHDSCDLVLHDSTVSRFHCEIHSLRGRPVVSDLGSLNGTQVNGVGVSLATLHSGATIAVGRTQIRFDMGSEQVKVPSSERQAFGRLVGRAPVMRRAFALLERAAASDVTVLVAGEAGVGKRTAAAALHRESARRDGPLVFFACERLGAALEAELLGAFAAAAGGTLVLDEVADLPLALQPRLLQALEQRIASGGDVRVVATTRRNLRAEVNAKRFRSDLYHRIAVTEVRLPPLRDHLDDIAVVVEQAVGAAAARALDVDALAARAWPGNVGELLDAVVRAVPAAAEGPALFLRLPLMIARGFSLRSQGLRWASALLAQHDGDREAAARAAGVDRAHLERLLVGR
jgi:DNA-binding NtrC family response regulator